MRHSVLHSVLNEANKDNNKIQNVIQTLKFIFYHKIKPSIIHFVEGSSSRYNYFSMVYMLYIYIVIKYITSFYL